MPCGGDVVYDAGGPVSLTAGGAQQRGFEAKATARGQERAVAISEVEDVTAMPERSQWSGNRQR